MTMTITVLRCCRRPGGEEPDGGDHPRHRRPRAHAPRRLQLHRRDRHHGGQRSGESRIHQLPG